MAYCRRAAYSPMIHRYLTFHYGDTKVYSAVHKLSYGEGRTVDPLYFFIFKIT